MLEENSERLASGRGCTNRGAGAWRSCSRKPMHRVRSLLALLFHAAEASIDLYGHVVSPGEIPA